jgi:MFS family permease
VQVAQQEAVAEDHFYEYSDPFFQFFKLVLYLAGMFGEVLGLWTNNHWGRKPTMIMGGVFFFAGAVLMAPSVHVSMLVLGSILLALSVGASPLFLPELAPYHLRRAFNAGFKVSSLPRAKSRSSRSPHALTAGFYVLALAFDLH